MTVSRLEGCEAGVYADVGRGLIDAKTEAGNLDRRVGERKEVGEGELGGRHSGLGVRVVVFFSFCSAFVGRLELGGQWPMVRMDVSWIVNCWIMKISKVGLTSEGNDDS